MTEQKQFQVPTLNKNLWVVLDGLPQLQEQSDLMRYGQMLESAARSCKSGRMDPVVFIPHQREEDEIEIDGCAMICFENIKDAKKFSDTYSKMKEIKTLSKNSSQEISVYLYSDYLEYDNIADEYTKIKKDEFEHQRKFRAWLLDEEGGESYRDQYLLRFKDSNKWHQTHIFWHNENLKNGRQLCYDAGEHRKLKQELTSSYVQWSPKGTYLVTFHEKGIQLFGGPLWKLIHKYEHMGVDRIDFSPNETKLVTCNSVTYKQTKPNLKIYDVLSGICIRSLPYKIIGPSIKLRLPGWWPVLKWSYNDEYFAKIGATKGMSAKIKDIDKIYCYGISTIKEYEEWEVDKVCNKSITALSLFNQSFSPTDNTLGYTSCPINNDPATVTLLSILSMNKIQTLKVQTLGFDIKSAHLYWQSQGYYVAILMGHTFPKSTKIKDHSIGIMTLQMLNENNEWYKTRDPPFGRTAKLGFSQYFSWQPNGNKFGIIYYRWNGNIKTTMSTVSIFEVERYSNAPKLLFSLESRKANQIHWAPMGDRFVSVHIDKNRGRGTGHIEFVDCNKIDTVKETHDGLTDVEWCPSGRYLVTSTTQELQSQTSGDDTGYVIWSFQGVKLFEHKIRMFYQILWRPRPPKYYDLNHRDIQSVKSKLNGWKKEFKKHDRNLKRQELSLAKQKYHQKKEEYERIVRELQFKSRKIQIEKERRKLRAHLKPVQFEIKPIELEVVKSYKTQLLDKEVMKRVLLDENVNFAQYEVN